MTSGNAQPFLNDPDVSRERIELETRVLAAALRQSLELGDTEGSSLAHRQIFYLLKASQEMGWEEPISLPPELVAQKAKPLPDIDWGLTDEQIKAAPEPAHDDATSLAPLEHGEHGLSQNPQPPAPLDLPPLESSNFPSATDNIQEFSSISGQYRAQIPPAPLPPNSTAAQAGFENGPASQSSHAGQQNVPDASGRAKAPIFSFLDFEQKKIDDGKPSFYTMLGVPESVDAKTVHCLFLRKVRVIVRRWAMENPVGAARREMQSGLQKLWVAHDVLMDPVTRADYDLRRNGFRQGDDTSQQPKAIREQVRIGELLRCAELLEVTELEIAADMHKAMPEIMFGTFLVKQGFIEDRDLDCVLLGQKLIKNGVIAVQQFQEVMHFRANSTSEPKPDLGDLLLEAGLITEEQLEQAYREQVEETIPRVPVVSPELNVQSRAGRDSAAMTVAAMTDAVEVGPDEEINAPGVDKAQAQVREEAPSAQQAPVSVSDSAVGASPADSQNSGPGSMSTLAKLTNSYSSVPSVRLNAPQPMWNDHLDWGSSETQPQSGEAGTESGAEAEAAQSDLVGAGAGAEGKKSLFDLMEGFNGASPEISEPLPEDVVLMSSVLNKAQEPQQVQSQSQPLSPSPADAPVTPQDSDDQAAGKDLSYDVFPDFKTSTAGSGDFSPGSSPSSVSSVVDEVSALPTSDDDYAMDEEMSALDAAAEEALFEEVQDIDEIEVAPSADRPASADEITAEDLEAVRPPASGLEVSTSQDLPSMPTVRPGNAGPHKSSPASKSSNESSGEWKIVSLPASEIASLFLGDKEDLQDKPAGPAPAPQNQEEEHSVSDTETDSDHQDPHPRRRKRQP